MDNNDFEIQRNVAFAAGFLQGDITIKALLESLAESVVIINESGLIVLINNRMEELTGYSRSEVMGLPLNTFVPDEFHSKHNENIQKFFREPRMRPMGVGLELLAKKRDGVTFPVEISLSFLETEVGNLGIAFVTDISLRKRMETELLERNRELDAYAHTVAHDLNSSLQVMSSYSDLLLDAEEAITDENKRAYLTQISKHSGLMSSVISELLLFSRVGAEGIVPKVIETDKIIENVCVRLHHFIDQKEAAIKINSSLSPCMGYAPWLEEVWFNLINNALKYAGTPPEITIGSNIQEDGMVRYHVKDNGAGVPSELHDVLFKEGNNFKGKNKDGTGLGLSIVKRIVEKMNGEVGYNDSEQGAVFFFTMPPEK